MLFSFIIYAPPGSGGTGGAAVPTGPGPTLSAGQLVPGKKPHPLLSHTHMCSKKMNVTGPDKDVPKSSLPIDFREGLFHSVISGSSGS